MSMLLLLCAAAHGLLAGGTCQPTARRAALSLSLLSAASTWDDETLGGLSGAMHLAIRCGDAARVRELLDEAAREKGLAAARGPNERQALTLALARDRGKRPRT